MESIEKKRTSTFTNKKGQQIFFRNWVARSTPKAVLLVVHGLNSHSSYYQYFAAQLNENYYEVYAIDIEGRGNSEGNRYYIADYRDTIADIDQLFNIIKAAHPKAPVFLMGHSAGGVFSAVYAALYQDKLSGFICESFAFRIPAPGFALAFIKLLSYILPHASLIKLKNEDFSRDKSVVYKMNSDLLITDEKQPAKTIQQLLLAADVLKKQMPDLHIPLLILHGTADKVTRPEGSKYFMEHAASPDKQLKLYEGHYHDLLNDKYSTIVIKDIIHWLNGRA
jgi:alpha-beta hydrolase superfamily lysophospholipase